MRPPRISAIVGVLVLLVLALGSPASAGKSRDGGGVAWAPAASARIHPGVQMFTDGAQCTANFVFTGAGGRVYVGYAAHCVGQGSSTDTNGCTTKSLPLGTRVRFAEGATAVSGGNTVGRGTLVYSSWLTMSRLGTTKANVCAFNDFALVRVDAGAVSSVNPSVPFWGGPVGLSRTGASAGDSVYSFGQSVLRPTTTLSPKTGASLGGSGGGWSWEVYTVTPGIPGDSGSGFLDASGSAFGTLSTITFTPLAGSNGLGDLGRELAFAQAHSGIASLRLVPGTEAFSPLR